MRKNEKVELNNNKAFMVLYKILKNFLKKLLTLFLIFIRMHFAYRKKIGENYEIFKRGVKGSL